VHHCTCVGVLVSVHLRGYQWPDRCPRCSGTAWRVALSVTPACHAVRRLRFTYRAHKDTQHKQDQYQQHSHRCNAPARQGNQPSTHGSWASHGQQADSNHRTMYAVPPPLRCSQEFAAGSRYWQCQRVGNGCGRGFNVQDVELKVQRVLTCSNVSH
jgi:hypothetical protein